MAESLSDSISHVSNLLKQGDLLQAFDSACEYIHTYPDAEVLKHKALQALANAGATQRAAQLFESWGLNQSINPDVLAFEARIAKDSALKASGDLRAVRLLEAANAYRRVHEKSPSYYTAINWGSLAFLADDPLSAVVAEDVLRDPEILAPRDYWSFATRAEAHVLVGDLNRAAAAVAAAAAHPQAGATEKSRTTRQLRMLLAHRGLSPTEVKEILAPLAPAVTLHVMSTSAPGCTWQDYESTVAEEAVRERVYQLVSGLRPGAVFASLGTGAEIMIAEAALAMGAEVTVVMPVTRQSFVQHFVASRDGSWESRFDLICSRATRVVSTSIDPYIGDPGAIEHGDKVAMGLTLLRAQHLEGEALQILIEECGVSPEASARPSAAWMRNKSRQQLKVRPYHQWVAREDRSRMQGRTSRAIVFGDVPGFSKLSEDLLPAFWQTVMRAIGEVVAEVDEAVLLRNTWGDAVHLIVRSVEMAAHVCLEIQTRLSSLDATALGASQGLAMRIGAHFGPVFEGWDPVARENTYFGRALSQAARIEPITPSGAVYVTEAFAAMLLLETASEFTCTYVGRVPLAKGFGTFRMYDLVASAPGHTD